MKFSSHLKFKIYFVKREENISTSKCLADSEVTKYLMKRNEFLKMFYSLKFPKSKNTLPFTYMYPEKRQIFHSSVKSYNIFFQQKILVSVINECILHK